MEPLRKGLLRSLGCSEANFLEVCFGRFPSGNFHTKATSKKSRSPSGNFRQNPPRTSEKSFPELFQSRGWLERRLSLLHRQFQCRDWQTILDTVDGPSDEEGEKDAKRQRSEPTTPISISSRPPHEYDDVTRITQVEQRETDRFEEGVEPEFQDAEEGAIREENDGTDTRTHEAGVFHGACASATFRKCLDRINQRGVYAPAPCHSGVDDLRECLTRRRNLSAPAQTLRF